MRPHPVLAALCAVALLAGCTAKAPDPSSSATEAPYIPDAPSTEGITPVVVVAGPDTDGESVSASGYVAGVVESGGDCRFQFRDEVGGSTEASSAGESDSSTTSCGLVSVPRDSLVKGTWTVTLSYVSIAGDTYTSVSVATEIP